MGQPAFGRSYRAIASLLLLISFWGAPHRQQDDAACLPITAGEHDASNHAFAPTAPPEHDHCAVCHWMRGLKPTFVTVSATATVLDGAGALAQLTVVPHASASNTQLPARAPPATL
jgi:hypothetical protein